MNPIVLAGLFGLAKGVVAGRTGGKNDRYSLGEYVQGAALEEFLYRAAPIGLSSGRLNDVVSSTWFALDHVIPEAAKGQLGVHSVARFADTFAGGMMYSHAFRRYGFAGSFAAHLLHNLACDWGRKLR